MDALARRARDDMSSEPPWPAITAALATSDRLPRPLHTAVQRHLYNLSFTNASHEPLPRTFRPPVFGCPHGQRERPKSVRVFDLFLFSFELDVLEMRLYELNATVDAFVIVESPWTLRGAPKPLVYQRYASRFAAFASKIVHVVVPTRDLGAALNESRAQWDSDVFYGLQLAMQAAGWERLRALAPQPTDLLVLGDVDEIPGARLMHELTACEPSAHELPLRLQSSFHRFTFSHRLGDAWPHPVVVRFDQVPSGFDFVKFPSDLVKSTVRSGFHLNRFGPPALQLFKHFANGEGGSVPVGGVPLLRDPNVVGGRLVARGIRICCPGDAPIRPSVPQRLPAVVRQNLPRYKAYFHPAVYKATIAAVARRLEPDRRSRRARALKESRSSA